MNNEMISKLTHAIAHLGDTFREFGMEPPKGIVCANRRDADLLRHSSPSMVKGEATSKPWPRNVCCKINGVAVIEPIEGI